MRRPNSTLQTVGFRRRHSGRRHNSENWLMRHMIVVRIKHVYHKSSMVRGLKSSGENPPEGALLTFHLKAYTGEQVKIKITNSEGQPVAKFKLTGTPGLNRINWDLKPTKDLLTEYGGEGQKFVKPGEYTVTLNYGQATDTQKLKVDIAPGIETR